MGKQITQTRSESTILRTLASIHAHGRRAYRKELVTSNFSFTCELILWMYGIDIMLPNPSKIAHDFQNSSPHEPGRTYFDKMSPLRPYGVKGPNRLISPKPPRVSITLITRAALILIILGTRGSPAGGQAVCKDGKRYPPLPLSHDR